jgi:hypothetical protein
MTAENAALSHDIHDPSFIRSAELKRIAGGVTDETLVRWVRSGVIPEPRYINRQKYWPRAETLKALRARKS